MGKIKKLFLDLPFRASFVLHVVIFIAIALILIAVTASFCQRAITDIERSYSNEGEWFYLATPDGEILDEKTKVWKTETVYTEEDNQKIKILNVVTYLCIPAYSVACLMLATLLFYRNKMSKPLAILQEAHQKITENDLDFKIEYASKDEMGSLCDSFEKMRAALLENNRQMWRQIEQRKRLNAAFAHDLRTPLTVLKGYSEILQYEGETQTTKETATTMTKHIGRLEQYVESMSNLQRLEDIVPNYKNTDLSVLFQSIQQTATFICEGVGKKLSFQSRVEKTVAILDGDIISEVLGNLVSNAARHAKSEIRIDIAEKNNIFEISVTDDGDGFSPEGIQRATEPYYTDDADRASHLGIGLYICKVLCGHHDGDIQIGNADNGAMVIATFEAQN